VIFPWIGLSIAVGMYLLHSLEGRARLIGRGVSFLTIVPCLIFSGRPRVGADPLATDRDMQHQPNE